MSRAREKEEEGREKTTKRKLGRFKNEKREEKRRDR